MKTTQPKTSIASVVPYNNIKSPFFQPEESRKGVFGSEKSQESFFKPAGGIGNAPMPIQAKLTIGQPGDKYEQEADAMADQVVQKLTSGETGALIQPKCAECAQEDEEKGIAPKLKPKSIFESNDEPVHPKVQRKCSACTERGIHRMGNEEAELELQAKAPDLQTSSYLESQLKATKGGGEPLSDESRTSMESAFGTDFSGVRVHTNSGAAQMNQELGAQAFAHGPDIYFNSGKYSPGSTEGQRLLGHELTHVVQQRGKNNGQIQRQPISLSSGHVMGHIHAPILRSQIVDLSINFDSEITPAGQLPRHFNGYPNRTIAAVEAGQQSMLTGLVEDHEAKYHVLRTTYPKAGTNTSYNITPTENPQFVHLWWIGASDIHPGGGRSEPWADRVARARNWYSAWQQQTIPDDFPGGCPPISGISRDHQGLGACLKAMYKALLSEAVGIDEALIYAARSHRDYSPTHLITFDLYESAHGSGGTGRIPTDRSTGTPQPILNIGPSAFVDESSLHTLGTAIHEAEHFQHATDGLRLLRQWRRSRSREPFDQWLRTQLRQRRITQEQYDLVVERMRGGDDVTESLVRLRAFTSTYHRLPITTTVYRFSQIDGLAGYWPRAGHTVGPMVIRELAQYYRALNSTYQRDFAAHARRLQSSAPGDYRLFWNHIVQEILQ